MSVNKMRLVSKSDFTDSRRGLFQALTVTCHIAPQIFTVHDCMQLYAVDKSMLTLILFVKQCKCLKL